MNDAINAGALERVFTDICDELGCAYDNEAALEAIAKLKAPKATVEREATLTKQFIIDLIREKYDPVPNYWLAKDAHCWDDGTGEIADAILARLDEAAIREKAFEDTAMIARQVAINAERRSADHTNLDAKQSALDKMEGDQEAEARIRQAASAIRGGKQP